LILMILIQQAIIEYNSIILWKLLTFQTS
jgi:hypothetical protein